MGGCQICGRKLTVRTATKSRPFHYTLSGLPDVYLVDVKVYRCEHCNRESAAIPRIEELNRSIAAHLAEKHGKLTGPEVRFIRKQAGLSAKEAAAFLALTPARLSRVENEREQPLGGPSEQLVRVLARAASAGDEPIKTLLTLTTEIRRNAEDREKKFRLDRNKNRWRAA